MPGGVLTHPPDDATGPQEISGEIRADVISRVYCLTESRLAHSAQPDGANSLRLKRRRAIWQDSSPGKQTWQTSGLTA
jgi:hypothetical protein